MILSAARFVVFVVFSIISSIYSSQPLPTSTPLSGLEVTHTTNLNALDHEFIDLNNDGQYDFRITLTKYLYQGKWEVYVFLVAVYFHNKIIHDISDFNAFGKAKKFALGETVGNISLPQQTQWSQDSTLISWSIIGDYNSSLPNFENGVFRQDITMQNNQYIVTKYRDIDGQDLIAWLQVKYDIQNNKFILVKGAEASIENELKVGFVSPPLPSVVPAITNMTKTSSGEFAYEFANLTAGTFYYVQSTSDLTTGSFSSIQAFTAQGTTHTVTVADDGDLQFIRVVEAP